MSILAPEFSFAFLSRVFSCVQGATASIPPWMAATTMPADKGELSPAMIIGVAASVLVALLIAFATGVFRPSRVDGPLRMGIGRPAWPLAMVIGVAVAIWFGSSIFYFAVKQTIALQQARTVAGGSPASRPVATHANIVDFAILSTVPGVIVFAWLLYSDRQLTRVSQLQLGFTAGRSLDGVAKGLLASVMILPVMFVASAVLEALYIHYHYEHPNEHELLRLMNEAPSPLLRWWLIGGATITAPFFEEYLFRGFVQTFVRQTFIRWALNVRTVQPPLSAASGFPGGDPPSIPLPPAGKPAALIPDYGDPSVAPSSPTWGRHLWQTWAAILITSVLFASVHEAWTRPLIFMLAVFLGYAYERTGSLWTTITIHLVFNATNTVIFLMSAHGG
jgi:membrane protease YdiL (CAAX protease family)